MGLETIFADPATARHKAAALRDKLLERRTTEQYRKAIAAIVEKEPQNG